MIHLVLIQKWIKIRIHYLELKVDLLKGKLCHEASFSCLQPVLLVASSVQTERFSSKTSFIPTFQKKSCCTFETVQDEGDCLAHCMIYLILKEHKDPFTMGLALIPFRVDVKKDSTIHTYCTNIIFIHQF